MTWSRFVRRLRAEFKLSALAAWRGLVELVGGNDFTHAAAIAYYSLLSLFPFLLLVLSFLRSVAGNDNRDAVIGFVFQYFPPQVGDFVRQWLTDPPAQALPTGVAGALALTWASLGVFGAITSAVNEAWGVEQQRSFLKHRLVSFLMLVAAGLVMVIALLLVSAITAARAPWFGDLLARFSWLAALQTLAFDYLATVLLIVGVGLVFYFIPNARIRFRDVWVGAILTGALWRLAFDAFSWYLRDNSRLTEIHTSIAAVVIFLLWIYISAVILMFGVEFTASHARLRRRRSDERSAAPPPRS